VEAAEQVIAPVVHQVVQVALLDGVLVITQEVREHQVKEMQEEMVAIDQEAVVVQVQQEHLMEQVQ
jgi:hypothetical protein